MVQIKYGYIKAPIVRSGEHAHLLGGVLPKEVIFPDGHGWGDFLPKTEIQRNTNFDTESCTVYGSNHALAMLMKKKFGGDQDFSERFIAVLAGLDGSQGTDPHITAEAIRKNGEIPESELPFDATVQTAKDYFSPKPMTQDYIFSGQNFLTKYSIQHEWILDFNDLQQADVYASIFKEYLKYSPIGLAVYAWASRNQQDLDNGIMYRPDGEPDVHYVTLFDYVDGEYWIIFDSYDKFIKKLEWNFGFERAKRFVIIEQPIVEQKISLYQRLISTMSWLLALLQNNKLGRLFVHQGDE